MNIHHITSVIVFASVAALAAPASAISTGNLQQDVHSALSGDGTITALVKGDTVTLIGNASALDKAAAERVAQSNPSVDEVINLIANRS